MLRVASCSYRCGIYRYREPVASTIRALLELRARCIYGMACILARRRTMQTTPHPAASPAQALCERFEVGMHGAVRTFDTTPYFAV